MVYMGLAMVIIMESVRLSLRPMLRLTLPCFMVPMDMVVWDTMDMLGSVTMAMVLVTMAMLVWDIMAMLVLATMDMLDLVITEMLVLDILDILPTMASVQHD